MTYAGDGTVDQDYTLLAFVLQPGAYVVLYETAGTNTATNLYFSANIGTWVNNGNGGIALKTDGDTQVDFVRWGNASVSSISALNWSGANPDGPPAGKSLGRDTASTDTDSGDDWTIQAPSPGTENASGAGGGSSVFLPIVLK